LAALCALAAAGARADSDALIAGPFETPPRLEMRRTETPPKLDGRLGDEVWRDAPGFRGLVTSEPVANGTPTEETAIRLLYDSEFLYVGVRCFDREPEKIVATSQTPDDWMLQDDVMGIFFDTFGEGRSGYSFATNPLGNRYEALVEVNRTEAEWDGIWYVRSRIDELGWTAEIKIPFKSLSFRTDGGEWGMQFVREVRRKNEKQRLMYGSPSRRNFDLADLPRLVGMNGMEQGLGVTAKPSFAGRYRRERASQRRYASGIPSADIFYRVTPALVGALTFNTDFSETPVDTRQLNLTRFAAFFPEQRDFFLEDAGIFDFGGLSKESGVGTRDTPTPISFSLNGMPFFSRSIGIAPDGENVDLEAGARLTGRVGRTNLGLLSVRTESHEGLERKLLNVARVSYNVLEESRIGMIATQGDPAVDTESETLGADFNYRSSRIFGDQILLGSLFVLGSDSDQISGRKKAAFGGRIEYPNDRTTWRLSARELQEDYRPALGFANRTGIRQYGSVYRRRFRSQRHDSPLHWVDTGWDAWLVTDVNNELESSEVGIRLIDLVNRYDDKLSFRWIASEERLDEPFEIFPGVDIRPGNYSFTRGEVSLALKDVHPLSGRILFSYGSFYSGRRFETDIRLIWRPSRHWQLEADWIQADVRALRVVDTDPLAPPDNPTENFTSRVLRGRVLITFNIDVSWDTVVQYDNMSDSMGVNSRLRWELEPGNDLYLVFNQGWNAENRTDSLCSDPSRPLDRCTDESTLQSSSAELIAKVEWTFRF
jgi:hypothetical protein